jgi:hypothetical protein
MYKKSGLVYKYIYYCIYCNNRNLDMYENNDKLKHCKFCNYVINYDKNMYYGIYKKY